MTIKALFEKKVSTKTGKEYYVITIPDLKKTIFLTELEVEHLKLLYKQA